MPRYSFDRFCLDSERMLLERGGTPVHLTPRAYRLLEVLVTRHPNAVSKRALLEQVWSGGIVDESSLKTLVLEIRKALVERGGKADAIRTVFGFGYAFAASVREEPLRAAETLVAVRWLNQEARLPSGEHLIGRAAHCAVIIDAPSVSREHARLAVSRHDLSLEDLGSKNGTYFDDTRVGAAVRLFDESRLRIGEVIVDVRRVGRNTSTATVEVQR